MSLNQHPFETIFEKALRESTEDENLVADAAHDLHRKGYPADEIYAALKHFYNTLIHDADMEKVQEALDEIEGWRIEE